ncbi:MAG: hypothetical protein OFPII_31290 [Osedax symbiont Rs1]|nr:MAG: hypothetical protein OFPII_31290 [Osedax symbiont Rs1]
MRAKVRQGKNAQIAGYYRRITERSYHTLWVSCAELSLQ